MKLFDDIKLEWAGKAYTVPANRVLGAIARIEEVVTIKDLAHCAATQSLPVAKLSMAYGSLLRYAGAEVTDEEIYAGMFGNVTDATRTAQAIGGLLAMMIPKNAIKTSGGGSGNVKPTAASSRKRSRQPSD
jgi:hypothetical protein